MPGGLWLKCESCGDTIYRKELEEKGIRLSGSCDFHFTLPGCRTHSNGARRGLVGSSASPNLTSLDRLTFQDSVPYPEKVARATSKTGQNEALLCGLGRIEGRPVVIGGARLLASWAVRWGRSSGEKIALAADLARVRRLPLVLFTSSGGARMHEGMLSLMQMAKTSARRSRACPTPNGGFSICVMTNPTTGGVTASFASVCDLTLAEPGALIGFAGPRVIASTIKQELPEGFQRAEFLLEHGQLDMIVPRHEMRSRLAALIDFGNALVAGLPTSGSPGAPDAAVDR